MTTATAPMVRVGPLTWELPVAIAAMALTVAALGPTFAALPAIAVAAVAPALTRVDVLEHRLPNRMTVPLVLIGLASVVVRGATGSSILVPLAAGLIGGLVLGLLALVGGMGMGDAKLAAALGFASPTLALAVLWPVLACLAGGVGAVIALARGGRGRRIPFGPYLLGGWFAALAVIAVLAATGASST